MIKKKTQTKQTISIRILYCSFVTTRYFLFGFKTDACYWSFALRGISFNIFQTVIGQFVGNLINYGEDIFRRGMLADDELQGEEKLFPGLCLEGVGIGESVESDTDIWYCPSSAEADIFRLGILGDAEFEVLDINGIEEVERSFCFSPKNTPTEVSFFN